MFTIGIPNRQKLRAITYLSKKWLDFEEHPSEEGFVEVRFPGMDEEAFKNIHDCLVEGNKGWTANVAALVITVVSKNYAKNDTKNTVRKHDLGLAVGNLTVQAQAMGIHLHQMAGIIPQNAIDKLNIPEGFEPVTAIALGYYEGESGVKERKAVNEIAFKGAWK